MYRLVWEYEAKAEHIKEFEQVYSEQGRWVSFFRQSKDYVSTDLYRRVGDTHRFVAVDTWRSRTAYENFRKTHATDYAALDDWCRKFVARERMLGMTDDGKG